MLKGSCLCGDVSYTLQSDLLFLYHCHCEQCRAFSGSSFATNAAIVADDFEINDPGGRLSSYVSENGTRYFCAHCSSPIYSCARGNEAFPSLHCGSISEFPDKKLDANLWVSEKCPWIDIDQSLKNYEGALE